MNSEWLIERFVASGYSPNRYLGEVDSLADQRGDHALDVSLLPVVDEERGLRPAAVLIPIINHPGELTVLFTKRTEHLSNHPGQISFPGGRTEEGDRGAIQAALRETEEEVGIPPGAVQVLGRLDDYVTRTGFVITPVVGLLEPPVDVIPDPGEVAEVFEVPLSFLTNPDNHLRHSRMFQGQRRYFYAMPYEDYYIWGATAGMLMNLYQFLQP